MRNIAGRFAVLFFLLIGSTSVSMTDARTCLFSMDKKPACLPNYTLPHQDTVPTKPKDEKIKAPKIEVPKVPKLEIPKAPKLELPKKAPNIFKLLGEIFKFRKHANENEKRRVAKYINELGIKDSIAATEYNANLLIRKLSDTLNQNIDSLLAIINSIKNNELDINERQNNLEEDQNLLENKFSKMNDALRISMDKYSTREVSDRDLNLLASKIFPIIEVSTDIKAISEKMARIKLLENIRDSVKIKRTYTDTGGKQVDFYLTLKNKIGVYGFYNYPIGASVQADKLGYLNTLIYNAIYINSQTGNTKNLNGWDTSEIVNLAQKAKCKIAVTFSIEGSNNQHDFLNNRLSQGTFINTAIYLMKFRNAGAINISFGYMNEEETDNFNFFITNLYQKLKQKDNDYQLFITIPATTSGNNYKLTELSNISDRIILDFSKNFKSEASALASINALTEVISFVIKAKVLPEKLVVCLPYKGAKWAINTGYPDKFIEYINYSTIRKNYLFPGYTNYLVDSSATAIMDSAGRNLYPVRRIFYDDESTLSTKYDFILQNGIGGIAVNGIGDDFGYTGLWDELSFAFAMPDTIYSASNYVNLKKKEEGLSFFEKLYRKLYLYNYILKYPCEVCFENIQDVKDREKTEQYLLDLDVDMKMESVNAELLANHEDTFRSSFEYINYQLTHTLVIMTVVILLILLILGGIYIYKVRNLGDIWSWKKRMGKILIGVAILFILSLFTLLFSSNVVPFFGSTTSGNAGYSEEYAKAAGLPISEASYCLPDPVSNCINMPLYTLLGIIIAGLFIGYLLTRYLVLPLIKRDVIP
jgi:spore germination protein YaaH